VERVRTVVPWGYAEIARSAVICGVRSRAVPAEEDCGRERAGLLAVTSLFVVLNVPMLRYERIMRSACGRGIVALELAGSPSSANALLAAWGQPGRQAARRSLRLDFPYAAVYTASLVLVLRAAARGYGSTPRGRWVRSVIPAALVAGGCDAVENVALLIYLRRGSPAAPRVARLAALTKFTLLAIVLANVAVSARQLRRGLFERSASSQKAAR
jgi:hypothetical protein